MKWFRASIGLLALGSILLQYYAPPAINVVRYISFFTIQSNLLAALVLLLPLFSRSAFARWLDSAGPRAAVLLYLSVTALVYYTLLRHLWNPVGTAYIADRCLHYVIPGMVWLEWWWFADKRRLSLRHVPYFLIFPVVYFTYTLTRGAIIGTYPYQFLNAAQLGYQQVLLTGVALLATFTVIGLGIIRIAQLRER